MREAPSLSANVIGQLANGTRVNVTGADGDWYTITYNGLSGYVYAQYIELD